MAYKKIVSLKEDSNFRPETGDACQGFMTIKIDLRSRIGVAQPFSTKKGKARSPQEVSNLKKWERLPKTSPDEVESIVSFNQVSLASS